MRTRIFIFGACLIGALAIPMHGARPQTKATAPDGETSRGQTIFTERCAICHYDQSTAQKLGPGLKGIYARRQFADGKKVDDAGMTLWIEKGGKDMPPLQDILKAEEIRALIAYLRTL